MKRFVLFSLPTATVKQQIIPLLFPNEIEAKVFAYMPSEGVARGAKHAADTWEWQEIAQRHNAEFVLIDNAGRDYQREQARLQRANILFITGGNTCLLLRNLRQSGLDRVILELARKDPIILAGYSAGAMIYTPSVALSDFDSRDNDEAHLSDFRALNLIDYEIAPHYADDYKDTITTYRQRCPHQVRALSDSEYIVIDR